MSILVKNQAISRSLLLGTAPVTLFPTCTFGDSVSQSQVILCLVTTLVQDIGYAEDQLSLSKVHFCSSLIRSRQKVFWLLLILLKGLWSSPWIREMFHEIIGQFPCCYFLVITSLVNNFNLEARFIYIG